MTVVHYIFMCRILTPIKVILKRLIIETNNKLFSELFFNIPVYFSNVPHTSQDTVHVLTILYDKTY